MVRLLQEYEVIHVYCAFVGLKMFPFLSKKYKSLNIRLRARLNLLKCVRRTHGRIEAADRRFYHLAGGLFTVLEEEGGTKCQEPRLATTRVKSGMGTRRGELWTQKKEVTGTTRPKLAKIGLSVGSSPDRCLFEFGCKNSYSYINNNEQVFYFVIM